MRSVQSVKNVEMSSTLKSALKKRIESSVDGMNSMRLLFKRIEY